MGCKQGLLACIIEIHNDDVLINNLNDTAITKLLVMGSVSDLPVGDAIVSGFLRDRLRFRGLVEGIIISEVIAGSLILIIRVIPRIGTIAKGRREGVRLRQTQSRFLKETRRNRMRIRHIRISGIA